MWKQEEELYNKNPRLFQSGKPEPFHVGFVEEGSNPMDHELSTLWIEQSYDVEEVELFGSFLNFIKPYEFLEDQTK